MGIITYCEDWSQAKQLARALATRLELPRGTVASEGNSVFWAKQVPRLTERLGEVYATAWVDAASAALRN